MKQKQNLFRKINAGVLLELMILWKKL